MIKWLVLFSLVFSCTSYGANLGIELGGSDYSRTARIILEGDVFEPEAPDAIIASYFVDGSLHQVFYTDSGTGEEKTEYESDLSLGGDYLVMPSSRIFLSAFTFRAPDQGLYGQGGEIGPKYNFFFGPKQLNEIELKLIYAETAYEQNITLSTRRGTRTLNPTAKQVSRGVGAHWRHQPVSLSAEYREYTYNRDLEGFLDFLNRPVVDYVLGSSTAWVGDFVRTRLTLGLSYEVNLDWGTTLKYTQSKLIADNLITQTASLEASRLFESVELYFGGDYTWLAELEKSASYLYIGFTFRL